jgi:hypothetical protein
MSVERRPFYSPDGRLTEELLHRGSAGRKDDIRRERHQLARVPANFAGTPFASMSVRFAPKADKQRIISASPLCAISERAQRSKKSLLNHLVGAGEQRRRDLKAECLRSFEIDN